jgi:purine-nucleoside phosphorylase
MWQQEFLDDIYNYLTLRADCEHLSTAVILGSGLGDFATGIEDAEHIPYLDIPHFPPTTIEGHSGSVIIGYIGEKKILAFSGRYHHYEGHDFNTSVLPVKVAHLLGVKSLIISNAAGGINPKFKVGDLMLIDDVIRLGMSATPPHKELFRYGHYRYTEEVRQAAAELGIPLQRGNYVYVTGPNYETPAEIEAFRRLGADAVGMSTVPELFEASRLHMHSVGISLISNAASGMNEEPLNHEEVKTAAKKAGDTFSRLVKQLILKF